MSMAVLSYDGALTLALMVDPDRLTDLQRLMGLIGEQLNDLARHTA